MYTTPATTLICVDQIVEGDIYGSLWNPFFPNPHFFRGILNMTMEMEFFFNRLCFPLACQEPRSFHPPAASDGPNQQKEAKRYMDNMVFETKRGEKATFLVQVQFRQNSSWQGTVTWSENKKSQRFRSTLELIKLIDSALGTDCPSETVEWE